MCSRLVRDSLAAPMRPKRSESWTSKLITMTVSNFQTWRAKLCLQNMLTSFSGHLNGQRGLTLKGCVCVLWLLCRNCCWLFQTQSCLLQTMWLNHTIKTLWPVYNEAIAKMAMEQAKPQIDAALKGVSIHAIIPICARIASLLVFPNNFDFSVLVACCLWL